MKTQLKYDYGDIMEEKPTKTVDVKGEICPMPDLNTQRALKKMKKGQILEVITDYPLSLERIPRTVKKQGHKILKIEQVNGPEHRILIRIMK